MSVNLPTEAQALYDQGWTKEAYLIRFDLPGKTVGYVHGPRALAFNGLTYLPNRYLTPLSGVSALGYRVTGRSVTFANVPTDNPEDAIAAVKSYDYLNAPCSITTLAMDPETGEIAGAVETSAFEVAGVSYSDEPMGEDGKRAVTLSVMLDAPGRAISEQTAATCGQEEQQFDNDATDTGAAHLGTVGEWAIEWGRI